jgi:hypothetical protein
VIGECAEYSQGVFPAQPRRHDPRAGARDRPPARGRPWQIAASPPSPPDPRARSDLQLIDADDRDPFDLSPDHYARQLVAGYWKNRPQGGLKTYMPDHADVGRVRNLIPRSCRE